MTRNTICVMPDCGNRTHEGCSMCPAHRQRLQRGASMQSRVRRQYSGSFEERVPVCIERCIGWISRRHGDGSPFTPTQVRRYTCTRQSYEEGKLLVAAALRRLVEVGLIELHPQRPKYGRGDYYRFVDYGSDAP